MMPAPLGEGGIKSVHMYGTEKGHHNTKQFTVMQVGRDYNWGHANVTPAISAA